MSEEFDNIDEFDIQGGNANLPNATAVLVLGILSIVTCWIWGLIGIILGIIAIALHGKDKAIYKSNPSRYQASFKNSQAGFICGIIGLSLSALMLIYMIAFVTMAAQNPSLFH